MKRDRIYLVEYQEKWTGFTSWVGDKIHVLANGSVEKAIAAARKEVMRQFYEDEETGKTHRVTGFQLLAVNVVVTADIEG